MRHRRLALVALVLVVAACGSNGDAGADEGVISLQDDNAATATSTTRLAADEAVLEVTRCMRERGVDVPDIGLTASGQLDLRPEDVTGIDLESEEFQEAFTRCIAVFQLSGGFDIALDPELEALVQDQLQEFSQCMRDNGVTDFPDPQTGRGAPYPLTAFTAFNDPAFRDAIEVCRQTVSFEGFVD